MTVVNRPLSARTKELSGLYRNSCLPSDEMARQTPFSPGIWRPDQVSGGVVPCLVQLTPSGLVQVPPQGLTTRVITPAALYSKRVTLPSPSRISVICPLAFLMT